MSEPTATRQGSTGLNVIAHITSPFPTKFGIPRQSGLVEELRSTLVFTPEYRNPDALRGLEAFSHLWLIWGFSGAQRAGWSPTVRPPRLGGNARMGVFATRSPFRPNPIGLSAVRIDSVEPGTPQGPVIHLLGADLMDGTPIYDIKPYLPYTDSHPEAAAGFAHTPPSPTLEVDWGGLDAGLCTQQKKTLGALLSLDPRPSYQNDPNRTYGLEFDNLEVRFTVQENTLLVVEIEKAK